MSEFPWRVSTADDSWEAFAYSAGGAATALRTLYEDLADDPPSAAFVYHECVLVLVAFSAEAADLLEKESSGVIR